MQACRNRYARIAARAGGVVVAVALAFVPYPLAAQTEGAGAGPPPDRSAWDSGWHVVRPGDTLEGLAERFLGSSQLWRELHTLNPFVQDPNLLHPGERLRIFLERPTPEPSAQVVATARKVNELPRPAAWRPAGEGDVLLEKDGLRTEQAASARLLFDDGAALNLAADSLIFIRRQTRASAPAPRKEIEIEVGQADVESPATPVGAGRAGTIEIVVGDARSKSTTEAGKPLKTRSRKSASSQAQFMVYEGASTVAAAGRSVEVPAGSGTTVEPKAAPSPAEPLLPAPIGLEPGSGGEFDRSAPRLAWKPVPGAASYVVEVCRDAVCGAIVEAARTTEAGVAPKEPLDGALYWRVTAVAASGLDGFPSPTQSMTAVASVAPPAPTLALYLKDGGKLPADACAAAVPELEVRALDRSGNAAPWSLVVDGKVETPEGFRALPLAGSHTVAARTTDERGRTSDSPAARLTLDGAGPWIELAAAGGGPAVEKEEKSRSKKEAAAAAVCDINFEIRDTAGAWHAVPCATGAAGEPLRLALSGERAELALRVAGSAAVTAFLGGMPAGAGEALPLAVWDVGCGLSEAAFRLRPSIYATGRMALEAEVADRAGNRRTIVWNLGR